MDDLGDLIALEGVKKYPVRIKCALLSANTLLESLIGFEKTGP
jgi:NifU-like protein involved in Fe-S cluster formation